MHNMDPRVRGSEAVDAGNTSEGAPKRKRGRIIAAAGVLGIAATASAMFTGGLTNNALTRLVTLPGTSPTTTSVAPQPTPTPAGATQLAAAGATVVGQRVEITGFGSNPGNLRMYQYIPANMPSNAPLVVVMHGCSQNASAMDDEPGWVQMANTYRFALVFPETGTVNEPNYGCFRSWDVNHNRRGVGESLSIKQMVDWMQQTHRTSRTRVFATGFSSGAINTSVLLAAYPDVFAAGAEMSGHPYRCAATYDEFVNCNLFSKWQTPQQWGDLVRSAYPGYTGPYPRISIWHGTADIIVNSLNADQVVKQWTNVHRIDERADVSDWVNGYPHAVYTDTAGTPKVERYYLTNMPHQIAINLYGPFTPRCGVYDGYSQSTAICSVYYVARWFGITT